MTTNLKAHLSNNTLKLTLDNNLTFIITKAHIKESLESLFSIQCEGYKESYVK